MHLVILTDCSSLHLFIWILNIVGEFINWLNLFYFRYHPDKNANDPKAADMFKEVTFSYNILSDPDKRRQYDSAGFEVI